MKKIMALLLAAVLMLGLVSCGAGEIGDVLDVIEETTEVYNELQEIKEDEYSSPDGAIDLEEPATTEPEDEEQNKLEEVIPEATEEEPAQEEPEAPAEEPEPADEAPAIDEDGWYTTKDDVALYIHTYGHLPSNFITKKEAQAEGWSGGGLTGKLAGMSIGGDHFGNYEGILPKGNYTECDIDTMNAKSRGAKRIVFSKTAIYYTEDHYETFDQLY